MKPTNQIHIDSYNNAVKAAYDKILKLVTMHISTIERHELRYTLQRQDEALIAKGSKVHQFISPIVYLSLESNDGELLSIHWGFEQFDGPCEYSAITAQFVRSIFSFTSLEHTKWNIQSCVYTNYVITNCSELYEVIEDGNRYFTFKLLPYRPATGKRKERLEVA